MERHKYLEEIIPQDKIVQNWLPDDERQGKWAEEREEYGFDSRETWNLDTTFVQWLYERLRMYKDIGGQVVDLKYCKFDVDGIEMTQLEVIDKMISNCEQLVKSDYADDEYGNILTETAKLWSIVLQAMWW